MILATYTNEQTNKRTELHQIAAGAFEVKRYIPGYQENTMVLRNQYYYDSLQKAQDMFNAIK